MFAVILVSSVLGIGAGLLAWLVGGLSLPGAALLTLLLGNGLAVLAFLWILRPGPDDTCGHGGNATFGIDLLPLPHRKAQPRPG